MAPLQFFKIDSRKLRGREWFRSTGAFTALIGWTLGRIGISITGGQRVALVRDWSELAIPADDLPPGVNEKFGPRLAELRALGFRDPLYYRHLNRFNGYEDIAALLISASGETLARILWSRAIPGGHIRARFETAFLSALGEGRFVWTCDQPLRFDAPPEIRAEHRSKVSLGELFRWHEETACATAGGGALQRMPTAEQAWAVYSAYESADFTFHEQRRVFVPTTPKEADADAAVVAVDSKSASRFDAAWAELQRQHTKKRSPLFGILLLLVTVAVSIWAGVSQSSLKTVGIVTAVLFLHELGHYLAMRGFKYREVRMFFIPLFGAAVTGKHFNVAGWKKALVSLLGPVPGIFLGAGLGAYAVFTGNDLLAQISLVLMGLNAFNLLPILPLDGGWFWNAVLFSRHRGLEIGFKAFAGLCGIAASMAGLGAIWRWLGIATLIGLAATWFQCRVVASLRRRGFVPVENPDDAVPRETADAIFEELSTLNHRLSKPKDLAAHALQVFERLNAKPPNWLETVGLAAVYFVSLVVAIVGLSVVAVYHIDPAKLEAAAKDEVQPAAPFILDAQYDGEFHRTPATAPASDASSRVLIAQFPSGAEARRTYEQIAAAPAPDTDFVHFGQSVIVQTLGRKKSSSAPKIAASLAAAGGRVSDDGNRGGWFTLNLSAVAPTNELATQLHHALDSWLRLSADLRPPAPWLGEIDPAIRRAGETWLKIEEAKEQARQTPELLRSQRQQMLTGVFRGGKDSLATYRAQAAARDEAERAAVARLAANPDPTLDAAVLAHELQRPAFRATDRTAVQKWRTQLHRLVTHQEPTAAAAEAAGDEDENEEPEAGTGRNWRDDVSGKAGIVDRTLNLTELSFGTSTRDLPALADWLRARGCTDVRYGVQTHHMPGVTDGADE